MFKGVIESQLVPREDGTFIAFPFGKRRGYLLSRDIKEGYVSLLSRYYGVFMTVTAAGAGLGIMLGNFGVSSVEYFAYALGAIAVLAMIQHVHLRRFLRGISQVPGAEIPKPKRRPYFEVMATYPIWFLRLSYFGSMGFGIFAAIMAAIPISLNRNGIDVDGLVVALFLFSMAYIFRRALRVKKASGA